MGFVATPAEPASHEVVEHALGALARLAHRGGLDADGVSGDGAGIMIQVPRRLLGEDVAVVVLFDWDGCGRQLVEAAIAATAMQVTSWRAVPIAEAALGTHARAGMPAIWQGIVSRPAVGDTEWEALLFRSRRRAEKTAAAEGVRIYIPSASCRTVVYKGLMAGTHLADFYLDLADPRCESQLAVFHQRYSTNTLPDWRLAQPFRFLAHNGEINTVAGNIGWMRAREPELTPELRPAVWPEGSDSAALDNVVELLVQRGYGIGEAMMTLVPDAWEGRGDLPPAVRDFYRYQSTRFEPWDGPAALAFSDGVVAGGALDRNGLRPLRYQVTTDGLVVAASEAGVVPMSPGRVVERGRLGPGQLLLVDTADGSILHDLDAKRRIAERHEYGSLADRLLVTCAGRPTEHQPPPELGALQRMHGWGAEDVKAVVHVMAATGAEPTYSMGDDIPIAALGRTPRRIYNYLRQRFAQVTNPPIDSLRERSVMSLRTLLGFRGFTLGPPADPRRPLDRRVPPGHPHEGALPLLELETPVLSEAMLARVIESAVVLDATFTAGESLRSGLERLCRHALQAPDGIVVLSDRRAGPSRVALPMALAIGAVHEQLLTSGHRMRRDLVAVTGDALDVHDVAMLLTAGAAAVHPHLGIATAVAAGGAEAEQRYRHALEHGLLKVMAKMGISCVASYCGAQVFEVLGLGAEVMSVCFPQVPSRVGGLSFRDLEAHLREAHAAAWREVSLPDHGRVRFRKAGEWHGYNPIAVRALQRASQTGDPDDYAAYRSAASMGAPAHLRDLLRLRGDAARRPIAEVEPASAIRKRFISTAMSLGALSPEAHEALAVATNGAGARSNSGEGGEDDRFYLDDLDEHRRDNRIKQVASGRFGVTPAYLRRADELEIKIAQGSKPGEGGQLPAAKVTDLVARLRHAQTGMQLISPPPHHDIYSIEDLAQLIYDLRTVNPAARIGVKLVAEAGVGTIAAGVAKAGADYILLSGHDGGTGASPLSAIKNAGVPWELGLAEAQQVLVRNRLRERVTLRTDGGLKNGRDIVVAALLGAEEFGFGTALLVALGCDMARQCHLNTCPTGIATQREDLRAKFEGRAEWVVNYLDLVAEEVRQILRGLGARTLDEIVGRTDLLEPVPGSKLDVAFLLRRTADASAPRRRTADAPRVPAQLLASGPIDNSQRAVGAGLRGTRREYAGSAGQSFGAWCDAGTELVLEGEANDYVGKGLAGGVITIRPFAGDAAADPVLAGNTCLYGATGGKLFVAGKAGERFAVRNSGAAAVVEGAGDHFCEYMTGGVVVSLGPVGQNVGAGMTGGVLYVREHAQLNSDSVIARAIPEEDRPQLLELVKEHQARTGSSAAAAILAHWNPDEFRQVVPLPATPAAEAASTEQPAPVTSLNR